MSELEVKKVFDFTHSFTESLRYYFDIHPGKKKIIREKIVPLVVGKDILDFGCGNGFFTKQYAEVANKIDAYEVNESALLFAKDINNAQNISYRVFDEEFFNNKTKYDAIICNDSLEVNVNWEEIFDFLRSKLNPKGKIYITCPNFYPQKSIFLSLFSKIFFNSLSLSLSPSLEYNKIFRER